MEICKTTKKFELPVSKRKRSRKDSKELTEKNIQSNIWNFADYHGIMEIKFTVISQSLYFKSVICSKTIYISDLYDTQFGSGHVHSNAGWLQDCEILIPIKQQKPRKSWRSWIPFSTPQSSSSSSLSSSPPLSSSSHPAIAAGWFPSTLFGEKSMAACNTAKSEQLLEKESTTLNATTNTTNTTTAAAAAVEEKKFVKITLSFRIIHSAKLLQLAASTSSTAVTPFLQPSSPPSSSSLPPIICQGSTASELPSPQPFIFESISNTTSMSEFHFLCSCAPAAVVLEVSTHT